MNRRFIISGIVQGVGFRPFVARLAEELSITGTVMNCGGVVEITAYSLESGTMDSFAKRLMTDSPKGSFILEIDEQPMPDKSFESFKIVISRKSGIKSVYKRNNESDKKRESGNPLPMIPPDLPLCDACRQELRDPSDRRYQYPFISCVDCGPRYSIINKLPYDRENITMNVYDMCPACRREYNEKNNRRRHAQTISCHDCGPQLILNYRDCGLQLVTDKHDALKKAIELIMQGKVIAIKGTGGYQFVCLPSNEEAVDDLRLLKNRDKKPFAVMFPDVESIKVSCEVGHEEEKLLLAQQNPIVLLRKKNEPFCEGVSGDSRFTGAFLPYTPLHQLLTDACGALVMTSGNLSSEPIITDDEVMLSLYDHDKDKISSWSPYLSGVLYYTRQIVTPLDDSVARIITGKPQVIRRSRGFAPLPIKLAAKTPKTILAFSGDLKSCFCLYKNDHAYLSQYFGDVENYQVSQVYLKNIVRMEKLLGLTPEILACDLHPNYITTRTAEKASAKYKTSLKKIQHHHAHAASVMAENDLDSCIAVVFDGTGYGTDGAVWGGEFLLCKDNEYKRKAHLGYVTICGGDAAAKNAALAAQCYLYAAGESDIAGKSETGSINDSGESYHELVSSAIKNHIATQNTSSMGRLFDAVSSILNIKKENTYEGECAIALENAAVRFAEKNRTAGSPSLVDDLKFKIHYAPEETIIDQVDMIKMIYNRVKAKSISTRDEIINGNEEFRGGMALAFHNAIAEMVLDVCSYIRNGEGENGSSSEENKVVLSGGVFANFLLTQSCVELLENAGFTVFINSAVPTNDGGISLGQAWLCRP